MHIYNVRQFLKEKFYGVPTINGMSVDYDKRALAAMADMTMTACANNNKHYWYLFIRDIQDRDVIRFLLRRNGLNPEFHISQYFLDSRPVFRVRLREICADENKMRFVKSVDKMYKTGIFSETDVNRYIDTIKSKISR